MLFTYIFLIVAYISLSKALKNDGADKKVRVGNAIDRYNLARIIHWAGSACYYAQLCVFFMKNSGLESTFVYSDKKKSALFRYIFGLVLVTLFCVLQILLVPLVS